MRRSREKLKVQLLNVCLFPNHSVSQVGKADFVGTGIQRNGIDIANENSAFDNTETQRSGIKRSWFKTLLERLSCSETRLFEPQAVCS